ncbi:hypothetical protein [uncultured Helicobacter sp.]|uniref:hypothetical protein n=1 Tax=uncultured Helicobacter sp. TaxID=175537 RepID=UPI00374F209A
MRFVQSSAIILCGVIILLTAGCARNVYKEVYVPTKCQITPTPKPTYTGKLEKDLQNILIYDEVIQKDLEFCTQGTK